MDTDYTINKLKEQKQKVHQSDTEVWLKTTYSFIEEYFKSYSSRAQSFQGLINDFSMQKIFGLTPSHINNFKKKATEYINETIQYLEELKLRQQKEAIQKANALKQIEEQMKKAQKTETASGGPKVFPATPHPDPIIKTQLPFGISAGLFWTIIVAFISGAFILGQNFGSSRFDKEKSDYYDQVKSLKVDTTNLNQTIAFKD